VSSLTWTLAKTDLDIAALYQQTGVDMKEDIIKFLAAMPGQSEAAKK
jgi:hypothetical protein